MKFMSMWNKNKEDPALSPGVHRQKIKLFLQEKCFSDELKLHLPNRKEFVDAYVNYAFNTSVDEVFQEFKQGFFKVCDWDLVQLFRPQELQGVLVGKDFHDWAKLKQVQQEA